MTISASIINAAGSHRVALATDGNTHALIIPPKSSGFGSSVNGGELLFLALATCYCNDLYREAGKRGITVHRVEVTVEGEFGREGEAAKHVSYRVRVKADADDATIQDLMRHTDQVAEIQNTVRTQTPVVFAQGEVVRD